MHTFTFWILMYILCMTYSYAAHYLSRHVVYIDINVDVGSIAVPLQSRVVPRRCSRPSIPIYPPSKQEALSARVGFFSS